MKKNITIQINDQKLSALSMYLKQKDTSLSDELSKYAEQLYMKNVPTNVREYIEMSYTKKSDVKCNKKKTNEDKEISTA